jgi:signal transduction histidine kinase
LEADFLAHPEWLAAQKADFILGPVFVGLYWMRQRPESRFGPLLIGFGAVGAVYILQSSSNPWLFGFSLHWENVIYLCTLVLILTFPTGRLDGLAAKLIVFATVIVAVMYSATILLVPQIGAENSISGCRALCPDNALAVTSNLPLAVDLIRLVRYSVLAIEIATAGLLIWRIVAGTPPQRRALMIGVPIALLFTSFQITSDLLKLVDPDGTALDSVIQWGMAGARSLIWYGFLFALIAAQLFAGRTLHTLVRQSLRRPSLPELEAMLREPLGDPDLRLMFLAGKSETAANQPLEPGPGRVVTIVERGDGTPGAAIDHDAQLADDPELLRAAGAVALLAAENAELDAAWNDALHELRESRARILVAGDTERRKIERNLHDGAQQRLVALRVRLELAGELIGADPGRGGTMVRELGSEVEEALEEVRALAGGIYPSLLADRGIAEALRSAGRRSPISTTIHTDGVGRYPPELESAVYFCCLEALQNAAKHAQGASAVSITIADDGALRFAVRDDGIGFAAGIAGPGRGLTNMHDRLAAVGGELTIESAPGEGTSVVGVIHGLAPASGTPNDRGRPTGS